MAIPLPVSRRATRGRAASLSAPLVLLVLLMLPSALGAAGPATGAQSAGDPPHFMGALMSGMVILMVPAFLVCLGITIMAYRRHKRSVEE